MAVYSPTGSGTVRTDRVLTNISIAYPNNGFVGDNLFPQVPVVKQSDKYRVFGRESWRVTNSVRAPGAIAHEVTGLAVSEDSYYAQEHALQIAITDEERENVESPLAPDQDGTELITSLLLMERELAIKTLVTTAANYAAGHSVTLAGTSQWSDYVNSDPISNFRTGVRAIHGSMFVEPNLAVIPYQVMSVLEDHPDFIERIKYSERGILTPEIISAVIGIPNIIVPGLGYNSANANQTPTLSYMWGKDVLLAYVPPRAGLKVPAFGYEFVWGYGGRQPMLVDRWREDVRKCDLIRVQRRYDLKLTAKNGSGLSIAGYLIKDAIA